MYVCLSGCHTNQIIRLIEDERNFKENLLFKNNWFMKELIREWVDFYLVGFFRAGGLFLIYKFTYCVYLKSEFQKVISKSELQKVNFER